MTADRKLKALRNARKITGRQVEEASRRIAAAKGDKRFCISNAWLAQLEKGVSEPSICKLFSLSVIYRVKFSDLIRLYDVHIEEIEKYESVANPHRTQLLSMKLQHEAGMQQVADTLRADLRRRPTSLLPEKLFASRPAVMQSPNVGPTTITYGYIGLDDSTMYPLIRPGSFVRIDTSQNKLQSVTPHNEYDRPIYFVELRDAFACGWCELQSNELLIIPHHSSPGRIRRFTYMKDAEIVGRVIGFETSCVDEDGSQSETASQELKQKSKSTAR